MVEAAAGLAFVCTSIAVMLRQVDKTTSTTPYDRERAKYKSEDDSGMQDRRGERFDPKEYVAKLSLEVAAQLPHGRTKRKYG